MFTTIATAFLCSGGGCSGAVCLNDHCDVMLLLDGWSCAAARRRQFLAVSVRVFFGRRVNGCGSCGRCCSCNCCRMMVELVEMVLFVYGCCHHLLLMVMIVVVEVAWTEPWFIGFQYTRRIFQIAPIGRCVQRMMGQREHAAVRRGSMVRVKMMMVMTGR